MLRRPADSESSDASAGTSPGAARTSACATKALFVSAEPPYPLVGGGALRSASILEFLAQRYEVDVILFHEAQSPDPRVDFPEGRARRITLKIGREHV